MIQFTAHHVELKEGILSYVRIYKTLHQTHVWVAIGKVRKTQVPGFIQNLITRFDFDYVSLDSRLV